MPQRIEFEGVIHEFPDDFTDEEIAAALGGGGDQPAASTGPPMATAATGMALGAMKAAPAIVSGINATAKTAGNLAQKSAAKYAVGGAVIDAAGRVARGDYKGAAATGGTAIAMSQVPRAAGFIQRVTAIPKGFRPPGVVMNGANALSRMAGVAAVPLTILSTMSDARDAMIAAIQDPATKPETRQAYLDFLNSGAGN